MHEGNYQQLSDTFLEFYIDQKQTLMFHQFIKQLYHTFVESYIDQEHILLQKRINCMFIRFFWF